MKLSDFEYDLPEELIAQYPLEKRDEARLLVVDRVRKTLTHDIFQNLPHHLPEKSTIVMNNSRVIHARLIGKKEPTGAKIEVFLLNKHQDDWHYEVLMKPMKRLKNGDRISFEDKKIYAEVIDKDSRIIKFNRKNITTFLEKYGHIPLPPYIKRSDEPLDRKQYQTVYAKHQGSVAAPTAGLHFSRPLLNRIKKLGHALKEVTLHINYGTFKPVEVEDITQHKMHTENYHIDSEVWNSVRKAKSQGRSVMAIGTTSARVLESVAQDGQLDGETNIFMYPGYEFKMVDVLLTNFHLPQSTLLMLVGAFGGLDLIRMAYKEAVSERYRFFSYGDAMLIK